MEGLKPCVIWGGNGVDLAMTDRSSLVPVGALDRSSFPLVDVKVL